MTDTSDTKPALIPGVISRVVETLSQLSPSSKPTLTQIEKGKPALQEVKTQTPPGGQTNPAPEEPADDEPLLYVLAPSLSCAVFAGFKEEKVDPLEYALALGYKKVYLITPKGVLLHQEMVSGMSGVRRFIRTPVAEIPRFKLREYEASMNFFPAGKIPTKMLAQVKAFFKEVIRVKKSSVEAMIWILWDPTRSHEPDRGYYLHVPNQRVAGASVSYDWSDLPAGSQIVVDIHSHANMGAFFSGTDDRDDCGAIRYSGVVGRNDSPTVETKWRFCMNGNYRLCESTEIFGDAVEVAEVQQEWLDKVTTSYQTYQSPGAHTYSFGAYQGRGGNAPFGQEAQGGSQTSNGGSSSKKAGPGQSAGSSANKPGNLNDSTNARAGGKFIQVDGVLVPLEEYQVAARNGRLRILVDFYRNKAERDRKEQLQRNLASAELLEMEEEGGDELLNAFRHEFPALIDSEVEGAVAVVAKGSYIKELTGGFIVSGELAEYKVAPDGGMTVKFNIGDLPGSFDANVAQYGRAEAAAAAVVDAASADLAKSPALLTEAIDELFAQVPEDEQLALFKRLKDHLSEEAIQKIYANGF